MGRSYYRKRLVIEVSDEFHEIVKKQAKRMNMTIRKYLFRLIHSQIIEREKLWRTK